MKLVAVALLVSLSACAPMAAGLSAFGNHGLGPNPTPRYSPPTPSYEQGTQTSSVGYRDTSTPQRFAPYVPPPVSSGHCFQVMQAHAVGSNPDAYETEYTTCGP